MSLKATWKKFAAAALSAAAMLFAFSGGSKALAEEADYEGTFDAYIYFCGDKDAKDDWGYMYNAPGNAGNTEGIKVTEATGMTTEDTINISMEFDTPVKGVHSVTPIIVAEGILDLDFKIKLKVDGQEVKISKPEGDKWAYEEDRKSIRLYGGYEEFDETQQYAEFPESFSKIEYEITFKYATVSDVKFDNSATYHAYFGFQTPKYSFRNAWNDDYGLDFKDDTGMDYFHQVTGWDTENNALVMPGSFTDAEIAGNGTFTVSVSGLDFGEDEFATQEYFNILMLSTDLPNTGEVTISDIKFNVDGQDIAVTPVINPDDLEYMTMLIQNIWNKDVKEIAYYPVPPKEMSITFTVSGFDHDDPNAAGTTGDSAPAETEDDKKEDDTKEAEATPTATPAADKESSDSSSSAKSDSASKEESESKSNTGLIIGIVVGVLAVCGIGVGVVSSKKKK